MCCGGICGVGGGLMVVFVGGLCWPTHCDVVMWLWWLCLSVFVVCMWGNCGSVCGDK